MNDFAKKYFWLEIPGTGAPAERDVFWLQVKFRS
jgi:hypothetical protein